MNIFRRFLVVLAVPLFLAGNAIAAEKTPSATLVIDETQVMVLIGGDLGGGTLLFGDNSYSFKTSGLKLGGVGIRKIHVVGNVYDLKDVADFPGTYFAAEAGFTLGDAHMSGFWLKNSKGVTLHMKTSGGEGIALSAGAEGFSIKMK
jgi:hypothetical protein